MNTKERLLSELNEQINNNGINVIHIGTFEDLDYGKIGHEESEAWYVYLNTTWYDFRHSSMITGLDRDETDGEGLYFYKETETIEIANIPLIREFLGDSHPDEVITYFNETQKQMI